MEIAPRTETDLRQLFAVAKSAFKRLPGWSDERILQVLIRDVVFVAREGGEPAGYVALRREEDGLIALEQLFVAPGYERQGVGRRLLEYAEGYTLAERARASRGALEEKSPGQGF
jgi:GNAT superfamily N-acetyltransferase